MLYVIVHRGRADIFFEEIDNSIAETEKFITENDAR